MKALSIHPEYAFEILTGEKTTEYRTWKTKYRGNLLICATARKTAGFISGHAVCVVHIADIQQLADETYAWQLTDLRLIKPFPVKGKLSLYNVDDALIEYPCPKDLTKNHGMKSVTKPFWEKYYEPLLD